jgi:hypothetical protein
MPSSYKGCQLKSQGFQLTPITLEVCMGVWVGVWEGRGGGGRTGMQRHGGGSGGGGGGGGGFAGGKSLHAFIIRGAS